MSAAARKWSTSRSQRALAEDVETIMVPVVEALPVTRLLDPDGQLIIGRNAGDPRSLMIRTLRTELLLRRQGADLVDTIALLSPGSGEGRTLLCAELAIAFAQAGYPTLLVDADLRHPRLHLEFGIHNLRGVAEAITKSEKPEARTVDGVQNLRIVTAGVSGDDPLELLSSRRFGLMIEAWRNEFAFIFIDTPPVKKYSDGLAVAALSSGVLTLSRANHTTDKDMQEMLRRLAASGAQVLGAVISHF